MNEEIKLTDSLGTTIRVDTEGRVLIALQQVEVNKISLSDGDVLIAKLQGTEFDHYAMNSFGKMLQKAFPSNKVIVLSIYDGHSITFDVVNTASGCNTDVGYCSDCSCGKKEQILSEKE